MSTSSFACKYCNKPFKHRSGLYRHQNHRCLNKQTPKIDTSTTLPSPASVAPLLSNISNITNVLDSNTIFDKDMSPKPDKILSAIQEQNQRIEQLAQIVQNKTDVNIEHQQVTHTTTTNNNYVTVYITEKVDFIKILTEKLGSRQKAVSYLKEKIAKKVDGDVDIFCDIYLSGPKETWSVNCADKKNYVFQLLDANNNVINDPGGVELYRNFKRNLTEALLLLTTQELNQVIDFKVGTDEFADRRDYLMDDFDLGLIQNKLFSMCGSNPEPFIKKVAKRIDVLERTFALSFQNSQFTNVGSFSNSNFVSNFVQNGLAK